MEAVDTVSSNQNSSFSTILNDTGDDFDIEIASVASSDDGQDDSEETADPSGAVATGISVDRADFMIEKLLQLEAELERLKMENDRLAESKGRGGSAAPAPVDADAAARPSSAPLGPLAPSTSSPSTQAAVQQHRSALSAVLSGLGGAKATLRPASEGSADISPRGPSSPGGMEGMLKASMAQRRMRLQEGDDDISIASDSSFESPGSAVAPAAAVAAAARCHRRTSTAPSLSSPLVAGMSPIAPPSAGSATSEGSGSQAARRRSSVSGRAKRRLASSSTVGDAGSSSIASPLSQGRRSMGDNGAVPLPRAMAMPSAGPRLPAPPAAGAGAGASASTMPARPAGMGALLGAIKSKGGVKGLKKAPPADTPAQLKGPAAGGLLGAIASFNKDKGLRKAKKEAAAPAAAAAGGGLNPAALMSAASRLNKTPRASSKAAATAAAATSGMRSPFGDMGAVKLRSTGRRAALK